MAERRMLSKKITDDDKFISLSSSAQALYLHLLISADDDGFSNQVATAMFKSHASVQDIEALLHNRFIYQWDNGVIVIKHWRMANALRKDRYTPTIYQEELSNLNLNKSGEYEMVATRLPAGCQLVATRLPQDRLGKVSIGKDSIGNNPPLPPLPEKKETLISVVENYSADSKIVELLKEFCDLRQKKKKPLTVRAMKMALKELDKLAGQNADLKQKIIEQTIFHAWDCFYAIHDNRYGGSKKPTMAEQVEATEERLRQKGIEF